MTVVSEAPPAGPEGGLGRRAAGNTIYIFIGSVLSRLMGLVLVGYLAREFDVAGLGSYNLVVAYTGLFSLLADFGLIQYLTRELAARPAQRDLLVRQAAAGSLAIGAIAFAVCNAAAVAIGYDDRLQEWILVASLPMFLGPAFTAIAVLNAGLRGRRVATLTITNQAFGVLVVLFVVLSARGIGTLIALQGVQSLIYAVMIAWSAGVLPLYRRSWRSLPVADGIRMFWAAFPLGAMAIIALVYYRLDTFMLSVINSEQAVGYYSGAWRLTEALHILPAAVTATMLPLAAWKGGMSTQRLTQAVRLAFRFLALIGVPILVACLILAEPIIEAVYGPALAPAAEAFRILIVTEVIFFFGAVAAATLVGLRIVRQQFILQLFCVPLNAAACVVILPRHSYNGAAWISLATELIVGVYLVVVLRRALASRTSILPWRPTVLAAMSSLPMAGSILWLRAMTVPILPTIIAGSAVFAIGLVALRGVGRDDLRLLSALRSGRGG
jgi:O-antigen/teichoic acid export membrane protein